MSLGGGCYNNPTSWYDDDLSIVRSLVHRLGLNAAKFPLSLGDEGAPSDSESAQYMTITKLFGKESCKR